MALLALIVDRWLQHMLFVHAFASVFFSSFLSDFSAILLCYFYVMSASYHSKTLLQLRALLVERGVRSTGRKKDLVERWVQQQ